MISRRKTIGLIASAAILTRGRVSFAATIEKPSLKLSVGGKNQFYYLPVTVVEQLGYFKEAGLDVEILDFGSGARSLQSLIGGSVDMTAGAYDHTVQMQAQGRAIKAYCTLGQFPGIVLGMVKSRGRVYRSAGDLRGLKIGVTAPGSSAHFMVNWLLVQAGLRTDEVSIVSVGTAASAVAAASKGEIDAISNYDPAISMLEKMGAIDVVIDTRSLAGTKKVYGGNYPAATLYMPTAFATGNPTTVQAMVDVFVRGLKWMVKEGPERIADIVPSDYHLGDKALYIEALRHVMPLYQHDGRIPADGGETALKVLSAFDTKVKGASIDLSKTFDNSFVDRAKA